MNYVDLDYGQIIEGREVGDMCYLFDERGSVTKVDGGKPLCFMTFPVRNGRIVNRHPDKPEMTLFFDTTYSPDRSGPGPLVIGRPQPPTPDRACGASSLLLWLTAAGAIAWNFFRLLFAVCSLLAFLAQRWFFFRRVCSQVDSDGKRSVDRHA